MSDNPAQKQSVPYAFSNHSEYADEDIYVAVIGITDGHVWMDCKTGELQPMRVTDNAIPGPVVNGNKGPGNNGLYANCFSKLSEISDRTVNIPQIEGCRILISFKSPLFLYFFGHSGSPSGYAAPNLANPTDPNHGIRHEMIELSNTYNGLWVNTTRVDSFQYPMGLEVWGKDCFYKRVGEMQSHQEILDHWRAEAPAEFQDCLDKTSGMIKFPTKTSAFQSGGKHANYLKDYIDAVWDRYAREELAFDSGHAGIWKGRIKDEAFVFVRTHDSASARIARRPQTVEAMEGAGVLASGSGLDKVVQAQFCAALNRHCIDLDAPSGTVQDWSDSTRYFEALPYNWYVKFWHSPDLSHGGKTYAFCYDDVFDQSATIHTPSPERVSVTIGPLADVGVSSTEKPATTLPQAQQAAPVATTAPAVIVTPPAFSNLIWQDDFDGPTLDYSKWEVEVNAFGGGNDELQLYTDYPENVRVENGCLVLEARHEKCAIAGTVREYSSGRIRTKHRGDWTYGRFEVCAKLPQSKGLRPAIWMLPTDEDYGRWAASGEIDIMEAVGKSSEISCALHFGETWPKNTFTVKNPAAVLESGESFANDFHVFAVNWRVDRIQWFVDGDQVWEQDASVWCRPGTTNAPFDKRFHLLLNLAVGGGLPGNPDHTTKFPAKMEVDWVRVYE